MNHPTYATLVDYIEQRLNSADQGAIDAHLALPCVHCEHQLAQLRTLFTAMNTDKTSAPPAEVLKRAVALHKNRAKSLPNPIMRVLATLQFDSRLQLSAAATRGAARRARQVLYSAPQVDIDLKITPELGEHDIVGQVLVSEQADDRSTAFVSLYNEAGESLMDTETDLLGQFALKKVPSGIYNLVFDLGSQEIAINSLEFFDDQG
jgi:hypothetical protein